MDKFLTANIDWGALAKEAWEHRENAVIYGKTKVGAAALSTTGKIYAACNVEHQFRSHDVHAEVNVISTMASKGEKSLIAILIVAERERFTPCGSCMDWIFQFGGSDCLIGFQNKPNGNITFFTAHELMPFYPH
jgi:cytidine deaminase